MDCMVCMHQVPARSRGLVVTGAHAEGSCGVYVVVDQICDAPRLRASQVIGMWPSAVPNGDSCRSNTDGWMRTRMERLSRPARGRLESTGWIMWTTSSACRQAMFAFERVMIMGVRFFARTSSRAGRRADAAAGGRISRGSASQR